MKQKTLILALCIAGCMCFAAGCGTGGSSSEDNKLALYNSDSQTSNGSEQYAANDMDTEGFSGGGSDTSPSSDEAAEPSENENTVQNTDAASTGINTDMLVYTCSLSIDTLDYDQSVSKFKTMLSTVGGFVENENYTDGQSSSVYFIEDNEKDKTYTATVRVPHDKYDTFLNGADQLGDVRSKSSNVQNVGQEYSDLNTTLSIYEAKEKRYIKMLSTITDDEQAIRVEKELTELQVNIAKLKTRMTEIRTDVDYSTINISIHEVTKYNEPPKQTNTFLQRLGNTVNDTWINFLSFLEVMLFLFIRLMPYGAIIAVIAVIVLKIMKKRRQKHLSDPGSSKSETNEFPKK